MEVIKLSRRAWFIVVRRYVSTLRRADALLSLTAFVAGITSSSLNRVFIFPVFIAILNARVHGKCHGQVTRLNVVKPTPLLEPLVGLVMSTSRFQTTYSMPIKSSLMLKQTHTKTSPSVHIASELHRNCFMWLKGYSTGGIIMMQISTLNLPKSCWSVGVSNLQT